MTPLLFGAAVLVIGYMVISRIVGLALRLVVPLVLIVLLGGAGAVSSLWPDSQRPGAAGSGGIGDIHFGDIAGGAVDAMRAFLQGGLALLGVPEVRERDPASTTRVRPPADPRYSPEHGPGERGRAQRQSPEDRYEEDFYEAPARWR